MKRRSDSFFGLHFDFHATPDAKNGPVVGATLSEEDIREICTLLKPDFLQIDCKGHPGWTSYPTACGNAMPQFNDAAPVNGDPLKLWRWVTKEEDVALYMHYSGVIDQKYCAEHPDQAVLLADGKRSGCNGSMGVTRTNGRYADDLMIPQLKELALKYGVNGVWVDGECWGTRVDFDPETLAQFERETGIALNGILPDTPDKPHYEEYREFCRELFRRHVRKYVDALHEATPDFQVASNWAYTDHMPEAVSADVDFLSGDFNPGNSFNSARYAARAIAQQQKTWDLMAWNFRNTENGHIAKHPTQIMQEAASVISLGGGFQNYITQYPDGAPRMDQIRRMKPLADFMRQRQDYCFRGHARHQAAILLSTYDRLHESESLYSRNGWEKIMGLTALLCDAGHSTEVVSEHTLKGHYAEYPVIIVPELYFGLAEETVKELISYAENGGSLVLVGVHTCKLFSGAGLPFSVRALGGKMYSFTLDKIDYGSVVAPCVIGCKGASVAFVSDTPRDRNRKLAAVLPFGKGKIGVIGADIGSSYAACSQYLEKRLMTKMLAKLYTPSVSIQKCEGTLEITDLLKDGKQFIQLVNANGRHTDSGCATEDSIPACRDIVLSIACDKEPKALIQRPCGRELKFRMKNGRAIVRLDRVDIHEIIEVVR